MLRKTFHRVGKPLLPTWQFALTVKFSYRTSTVGSSIPTLEPHTTYKLPHNQTSLVFQQNNLHSTNYLKTASNRCSKHRLTVNKTNPQIKPKCINIQKCECCRPVKQTDICWTYKSSNYIKLYDRRWWNHVSSAHQPVKTLAEPDQEMVILGPRGMVQLMKKMMHVRSA